MLEEGGTYKMVYFNVVPNTGGYRASAHEFKLVFLFKTTVQQKECPSIPLYGLNCLPFVDILNLKSVDNHQFLTDVMGLLTAVFPERQYMIDGKITNMVVIELTDPSGKLECALFGDYVDILRSSLQHGDNIQVVVVVQLARVKTFRGKTVLQNSFNATRLLFNPDIREAISFRNSIAEHGSLDVEPLAVVLDSSREGLEADFMRNHRKKTISELTNIYEDGLFIVSGEIVDMVHDSKWFYLACKCNKSVSSQMGVNFCETCGIPVLQVHPRFKVKVEIADQSGTAVVILFDRDVNLLVQKTCKELLGLHFENGATVGYPALLNNLIGRRMLFKVETKLEQLSQFDGCFPVRRVCYDDVILSMFDLAGADSTPSKVVFAPPFPRVESDILEVKEQCSENVYELMGKSISLGESETSLPSHWTAPSMWTPAKRKLDVDFVACQSGVSVSGMKSNSIVQVEDDHTSAGDLLCVHLDDN